MEFALITGSMILKMFIMMAVGMIGSYTKVINEKGTKAMTDILLYIVLPLLIVSSYQLDYSKERLTGLFIAILLSFLAHFIAISISLITIHKKNNPDYQVERMGIIYSNCGFMGIPLMFAIYGAEGVFYVTSYITVFNLLMWTHGVMQMTGKSGVKDLLKVFKSTNVIAVMIGISFFLIGFKIPSFILEPIQTIAYINTPMAMLVIGATLAQSNLKDVILNKRVYYLTLLRLILIPLITIFVFKLLNQSGMVAMVVLIAAICPTASTATMFALKFNKNSNLAAGLLSITTLLSVLSMPMMIMVNELL